MTTPALPPVAETTLPTSPGRKVNWGFWVWVGCSLVLTLGVVVVGTAWAVRHTLESGRRLTAAQQEAILKISYFPPLIVDAFQTLASNLSQDPMAQLINRESTEKSYWTRSFPLTIDSGYLLLSGISDETKNSIIRLIRISDGKSLALWKPNWNTISLNTTEKKYGPKPNLSNFRAMHPLLMPNGDVIFNTGSGLVRIDACNSDIKWILDKVLHHSNELDINGEIWTPSVADYDFTENIELKKFLKNDSLAHVSSNGVLLENLSFSKILLDNNLTTLFLGSTHGRNSELDLIHLNQITPALSNSKYWKVGDLLVSSRNLSTVFLYRPSTNKILWYQRGPWMGQHSVEFVNDHQISIFNNNISPINGINFLNKEDINEVMIYDFSNGRTSTPFSDLLRISKPRTITEGRARVLPDGGLFLEETNYGRHLRFSTDQLLWSRINDYNDQKIGSLGWSRYLTQEEVSTPLQSIISKCKK